MTRKLIKFVLQSFFVDLYFYTICEKYSSKSGIICKNITANKVLYAGELLKIAWNDEKIGQILFTIFFY